MINVVILDSNRSSEYEKFNLSGPNNLIYTSIKYKKFLKSILPSSKEMYLLAVNGDEILAALPLFASSDSEGCVINSLPFYGSNSAIIFSEKLQDKASVGLILMEELSKIAHKHKAISTTLISNPLLDDMPFYENFTGQTCTDDRIGQFTPLPKITNKEFIFSSLMDIYHSKTRNMIRKSQKMGFRVFHSGEKKNLRNLYEIHCENLAAIGGKAKSWDVFLAIEANFEYDKDYRVYVAEKDGEIAAALLVFYYNQTAEYFTPVINEKFRSEQPLSLLILEAMKEACCRNMSMWNWGGTWISQSGVYQFKSRWGTVDKPYRYYTREYSDYGDIRKMTPKYLLETYAYFFVVPFSVLEAKS